MQTRLIVLVAFVAVFGSTSASLLEAVPKFKLESKQPRILENAINDTINNLVVKAAERDPIKVEHNEVNAFGNSILIENALLEEFSNVYASHIRLSGILSYNLDLTLEAPRIAGLVERWTAEGDILYGDGAARFKVTNCKLRLTAKVNLLSGISVKNIKVKPFIGHAEVSVTGVYNDEKISKDVSDRLSYLLNDYVNNNSKFHARLSKIIQDFVDVHVNK